MFPALKENGHKFKDYSEVETVVTQWLVNSGHGLVSTGSSSQDETNASVGGREDVGKTWRNDIFKSEPFMLQFYNTGNVSVRQNMCVRITVVIVRKKRIKYHECVSVYLHILCAILSSVACLVVLHSSTLSR